ncbi:acyltransferase family protein [Methanoculleus frigidifontis]|nr:acyltransferase [Methanoculleus sp. FWC-SCC1]
MATGRHENNFDALRLAAATIIVVAHAYSLSVGYASIPAGDPVILVGCAALGALFVTSGYLITASWETTATAGQFVWKRFLRVVPALVPLIFVTLFVIGPVMTSLPLSGYFASLFSLQGILSVPFFENGAMLGLFQENPVSFVNSSLWTIPVEVFMYGIVAVCGVTGLLRRRGVVPGLILLNLLVWIPWYADPRLGKVRFTLYFLIGAYLYLHRNRIVYDARVAGLLLAVLALSTLTPYVTAAGVLCIPYLTLYAAHAPIPLLSGVGRAGDFSYGMYIYHYPLQQAVIQATQDALAVPVLAALSLAMTFPLAFLSWHLVERRALALKKTSAGEVVRAYRVRAEALLYPGGGIRR